MSQDQQISKDSTLRDTFVQMLFALAAGEVARQTADLITGNLTTLQDSPVYLHLVLAITLITTSWVGWKKSTAPGKYQDIEKVFSWQFVVLLIDVILVVCYFIIAKGVEIQRENGMVVRTLPSCDLETFWTMMIFAGYCLWDTITNVVMHPQSTSSMLYRKLWECGNVSFLCLGLAFLVWLFLHEKTDLWQVVSVDIILVSLVLFFRAAKQNLRWRTWLFAAIGVTFFLLAR